MDNRDLTLIQCIAHNSLLRFYQSNQLGHAGGNYNLCFSYWLPSKDTANFLINKIIELVELKAYLRQNFSIKSGKLMANFHEHLPPEINYYQSNFEELHRLEEQLTNEIHNLNEGSPLKISCINVDNQANFLVILNIHHIVMDGVTLDRFISDLNLLINNGAVNQELVERHLEILENETQLKEDTSEPVLRPYLSKIDQIASEIEFYIDLEEHEAVHYKQILPRNTFELLQIFCHRHQMSQFNVLLLVYEIFLAKIFNLKQMLVSYPINIRNNNEVNGCFLNVIDLPISFTKNTSFLELLSELRVLFPTLKLAAKHKIERSNYGRFPIFSALTVANLKVLTIEDSSYEAKSYPQITYSNISLKYREQRGQLYFVCDVIKGLFPSYFSETILTRFFNFLEKVLNNAEEFIINFDLLLEEEKRRIIVDFNDNKSIVNSENKTLNQLFEEQVIKTPDHLAVFVDDQKMTYLQLNQRANQLARYIEREFFDSNKRKIKPDALVPIFVERGMDMLIAMLAVLKTGAAYVPIDISFTEQRIRYILNDIQSQIILTQLVLEQRLHNILDNLRYLLIDDQNFYQSESTQNVVVNNMPNDLAYVIYTSGTTGMPKGVMIEHYSVTNMLNAMYELYRIQDNKKVTAYTSYVFDVSVVEIFTVLTQGGELHLLTQQRKDVYKLAKYLNQEKIAVVYLPPAILALLPKIDFPALKKIMFAGETCDPATGQYWIKKHELYNCYGPTEVTIYATYKRVESRNINEIGKPLNNITAYVLDTDGHPVCIGLIGELYLGGRGVARGYLNKQELTDERFVTNPFQTSNEKLIGYNGLIYKTGDLVRRLPDGNLEYIGRNDFQVKIMGHRVELREIEAIMQKVNGIEQSLVAAISRFDHHKFLCAYYVSKQEISTAEIIELLEKHLPHHMIPSFFVWIKQFPINPSGKIDRKLLPKPDLNTLLIEYTAPRSLEEEQICLAFSEALGLKQVGIFDDFFRIGGNSLNAIHLTSLLQHDFNIKMADIFKLRCPSEIAKKIPLAKMNFREQLEKNALRHLIHNKQVRLSDLHGEKLNRYKQSIQNLSGIYTSKKINMVLLTGGTGFLGCNLLKELLEKTKYSVVALVRAPTDKDAFFKLNRKFNFYFNQSLNAPSFRERVYVYNADIEKKRLGLSLNDYQELAGKIDSTIHAAGFVKHYGDYEKFHSGNVQSTINMLNFTALTHAKDFHYISTISILTSEAILTEDDDGQLLKKNFNSYIQSKIAGESVVMNTRIEGIQSNIYRVGNLAFILKNNATQENREDNAFYNRMKYFWKLKIIPEFYTEEITPVDLTAKAIIKLFDKQELHNDTFHLFNPNLFNISSFFIRNGGYGVRSVPVAEFIENIFNLMNCEPNQPFVEKLLLHLGLFDDIPAHTHVSKILQNRTDVILRNLCFEWSSITDSSFLNYLEKIITL